MSELSWQELFPVSGTADRYVELAFRHESPPAPPAFAFGSVPAELNRFYYSETTVYPVGCVFLAQAGLAGDGFPVRGANFLTAPAYGWSQDYIATSLGHVRPTTLQRESGRAVCLSSPGYLIYGHWLVDILPKLHLLALLGIDLSQETLAMPADTPEFGLEWLRALGVTPRRVVTYHQKDEIVTFDELVLPLPLRANSRASDLFGPAALTLLDRLDQSGQGNNPAATDRVYISRQLSGRLGRRLANADELEAIARRYGYAIVHPEQHSIRDQVAMFRNVRLLVGEYGSALHGTMFAPPGCIVCGIRGTAIDPGFLQSGMSQTLKQACGYVFGETKVGEDGLQTFSVNAEDLRSALHIMNMLATQQDAAHSAG